MRRQRTPTILTGLLALTLVAGCSGEDEDGSTTDPATPSPTAAPAPAEPTTASASPEEDDPDASDDDGTGDAATGDVPEDSSDPAAPPTDEEPPGDVDPADPGGGGSSGTPPPTDPPADGLAVPEGSGCTPGEGPLPDGQWYGEVGGADAAGVQVDLMCFFLGEEADKAALEDGEVMVPVPNGYYIRNEDPTPRTFDVAGGTQVLHYPTGDPATTQLLDYPEWSRQVANGQVSLLGVWLTVDAGAVVAIEEQWTP